MEQKKIAYRAYSYREALNMLFDFTTAHPDCRVLKHQLKIYNQDMEIRIFVIPFGRNNISRMLGLRFDEMYGFPEEIENECIRSH